MCLDTAAPGVGSSLARSGAAGWRWRWAVLLLVLASASQPQAHPMSHSLSRLRIEGRDVLVVLSLDLLELGDVDRDGNDLVSFDELEAAIDRIYARVRQHYTLRAGADPESVRLERYEVVEDGHIARLQVRATFARPPEALDVTSTLDQITSAAHRHLVSLDRAGVVEEAILDRSRPSTRFEAGGQSRLQTAWRFITLGIEHIVTGYDHLAFLVCLLLGAPTVRALVLVVTSFTVAHSVTLALATFDLVVLAPALVESLIAVSIAFVAVENLFGTQVMPRYRVTFFFGLIHGFGFSTILREMALPRANLAVSLFSFNLGVEIGQVVFVLLLYPLLTFLSAEHWRQVRRAASLAVFGLAVYWFAERAFLG